MIAVHPLSGVLRPSAFDLETGRLCVMASRHLAGMVVLGRDHLGLTGLTPEARFENHLCGRKASRIVKRFGVRLVPSLYSRYNPMTYEDAVKRERALATELRRRGYGVWQH